MCESFIFYLIRCQLRIRDYSKFSKLNAICFFYSVRYTISSTRRSREYLSPNKYSILIFIGYFIQFYRAFGIVIQDRNLIAYFYLFIYIFDFNCFLFVCFNEDISSFETDSDSENDLKKSENEKKKTTICLKFTCECI